MVGFKGTTVGYGASGSGNYAINLGHDADGSAARSVTINASSGTAAPSTEFEFGVYMTNNTTPDFEVVGGGTSTLRTNLNVISSSTDILDLSDTEGRIGPAGNSAWKLGIGTAATADAKVKILHGTYHDVGLRITGRSGIDDYKPLQIHDGPGIEIFSVTSAGTVKVTGQAYTALYANATNLVVDWNESNVQTVTVNSSSPTFAPTNPRAGATYILIIEQGATPVTIDWNSLVKWPGGTAPTLSSVTGKIDIITLICYNDSGSGLYYGSSTLDLA